MLDMATLLNNAVLELLEFKVSVAPLIIGSSIFCLLRPQLLYALQLPATLAYARFAHCFLDVPLMFLEHVLNVPTWRHEWAGVVDPSELPSIVLLTRASHRHKVQVITR